MVIKNTKLERDKGVKTKKHKIHTIKYNTPFRNYCITLDMLKSGTYKWHGP
jgi:hypothetical protein